MWEYEAEDGKHDMYMDIDEEIRFRVIKETFVDTSPTSSMLRFIALSFVYVVLLLLIDMQFNQILQTH